MIGSDASRLQALTLSLVLGDTSDFPPSNEAAKPEAPAETPEVAGLLDTIAQHEKHIEELYKSLVATRQRAEAAETKLGGAKAWRITPRT